MMLDFFKKLFGLVLKKQTMVLKETTFNEEDGPDLEPETILASLQPKIEDFTTTCIRITAKKGANLTLENSKFGGLPYFPKGMELPEDANRKPLRLLAQLNFAEIPNLEPYPKEGLLRFFIRTWRLIHYIKTW